MSVILDAGAFIAYERASREVQALLEAAAEAGEPLRTSTTIIAQVWRHGARQAALARLLRGVEEVTLTPTRARAVGELLRRSRTDDIADAAVVELARDGDEILTSDPQDLVRVAEHSGKRLTITPVT